MHVFQVTLEVKCQYITRCDITLTSYTRVDRQSTLTTLLIRSVLTDQSYFCKGFIQIWPQVLMLFFCFQPNSIVLQESVYLPFRINIFLTNGRIAITPI